MLTRARGVLLLWRRGLHASNVSRAIKPFVLADIGEGIAEVEVLQWFVKPGDSVREFDPICEVQSDKATAQISSRYSGTVDTVHHSQGAIVAVGQPLIDIDLENDSGVEASSFEEEEAGEEGKTLAEEAKEEEEEERATENVKVQATPAVRRIAKEHGVDLADVVGSGPRGRILKGDVLAALSSDAAAAASSTARRVVGGRKELLRRDGPIDSDVNAVDVGRVEGSENEVDMDRLPYYDKAGTTERCRGFQRLMVKSMTASLAVPHFGYSEEVALDDLIGVRKALKESFLAKGVKLTYMPFFIKACSLAMMEHPILNSSFDSSENSVTYHEDHNVGIAMDTPRGLVVPSIKSCQNLSLWEIAAELHRLQQLAASGHLGEDELAGTTFSLSNIGSIGGTLAAPVVVPPQVAIGAFGRIQRVPRFASPESNEVVAVHIMNVSWSGDHRVIDGGTIARFSNVVKEHLENPPAMMMRLR